ncbi:IS110 family transposase [Spirillospora sp. NBC_00431]
MTLTEQPTTRKALEAWVGVDTRRDVNVAVALDERGRKLADVTVPATRDGSATLLDWARSLGDELRGFAVEGTGSYGAGLTRHLQAHGQFVTEAARPRRDRMAQRNDGKSDTIDAVRAAKALLADELDIAPKQRDGDVRRCGPSRSSSAAPSRPARPRSTRCAPS